VIKTLKLLLLVDLHLFPHTCYFFFVVVVVVVVVVVKKRQKGEEKNYKLVSNVTYTTSEPMIISMLLGS
jgi:hypothetical protein